MLIFRIGSGIKYAVYIKSRTMGFSSIFCMRLSKPLSSELGLVPISESGDDDTTSARNCLEVLKSVVARRLTSKNSV